MSEQTIGCKAVLLVLRVRMPQSLSQSSVASVSLQTLGQQFGHSLGTVWAQFGHSLGTVWAHNSLTNGRILCEQYVCDVTRHWSGLSMNELKTQY